ncbi:hypothetical protein N8I77_010685 [Diaporthe amygdali]|uniref:Uncharacterized protein n=1 Tax=Phomopsis amygdali TaxID=1214568 RepID=A0AAD9S7Q3_PHOAM|nr:hypothetical protein N8I77_010685 [Diaporthe amygdali]
MSELCFGVRQSAWALVMFFSLLTIAPSQTLGLITAYLHQAFWCCVIEIAIRWPIEVFPYLKEHHMLPRLLQSLDPFVSLFWAEMSIHIVARAVQPFIVHASLSPTSGPLGILVQCGMSLCVIQVIHSVSCVLRGIQALFNDTVLKNDTEEGPITLCRAVSVTHGSLAHVLITTALYLERITMGTFVTSLQIVRESFHGSEYWVYIAAAGALFLMVYVYVWKVQGWYEQEYWDPQLRDIGRWRPTIPGEMIKSLCLRLIWVLEAWLWGAVPRGYLRPGLWYCPELAALWPESELIQFFAESPARIPSFALEALWNQGALRERHVDLWRKTGLTREYVLRDRPAIPGQAHTAWLGEFCYMVLGRSLAGLVWLLEVVSVWCVALAVAFEYF